MTSRTERLSEDLVVVVAGNPGPLTLDGTRSYLVGATRPVLIDPGPRDPAHEDALASAVGSRPLGAICLTHAHPDHAAGAEAVARRFGAEVRASAETLRRAGLAGRALADGEGVPVDDGATRLEALEAPGHSADHLCFLWRPSGALFTGDLVLGEGTSVVAYPDGSVGAYLASLARLAALRPTAIHPGHGPSVDDAVGKLAEYRRHRLDRDAQVRRAVTEGQARSIEDIRLAVYGELPADLVPAAGRSVRAHLAHLRETGHDLPPIGDE